MYEVTTFTKTIAAEITVEAVAEMVAREAFKTYNYVTVKKVITTAPWYAESVMILRR